MINYFLNLPDEIFDLILSKISQHYIDDNINSNMINRSSLYNPNYLDTNIFIRYKYIFRPTIRRIYYEYKGSLINGKPEMNGTMYIGTTYLPDNKEESLLKPIITDWLYLPFLHVIFNCNRNYKLKYLVEE